METVLTMVNLEMRIHRWLNHRVGVMAQSRKFVAKKNAWDGLGLAMKIYLPLSIISFFNEAINGQFCMWTRGYAIWLNSAHHSRCKSCKARNP